MLQAKLSVLLLKRDIPMAFDVIFLSTLFRHFVLANIVSEKTSHIERVMFVFSVP